jgi:hypothetical protein
VSFTRRGNESHGDRLGSGCSCNSHDGNSIMTRASKANFIQHTLIDLTVHINISTETNGLFIFAYDNCATFGYRRTRLHHILLILRFVHRGPWMTELDTRTDHKPVRHRELGHSQSSYVHAYILSTVQPKISFQPNSFGDSCRFSCLHFQFLFITFSQHQTSDGTYLLTRGENIGRKRKGIRDGVFATIIGRKNTGYSYNDIHTLPCICH